MKKLVSIFYDVRESEWKPVFLMVALHFLLMVVLYFLKPARDSLFLVETGPDQLPLVYIILAAVSLPVSYLVSKVLTRYPTRKVVGWVLGFLILNLVLLRFMFMLDTPLVYMIFYIWVGIFGILVISLFWLLANSIFNAAQSKRLFSLLTLSAILGSIFGSEASSLTVSYTDITTENLLYICVGLLTITILLLYFLPAGRDDEEESPEKEIESRDKDSGPTVIEAVLKSKYQLLIVAVIGFTTIATTFTDYQFKVLSFDAYPLKDSLTAFLGTFYAGISLASLAIQVLFSSGIIKKFGITGAVLTRPLGMMAGGVLMAIEPVLASVIILNGFDSATRYSIDKTGRELFFLPLSQQIKKRTKLFIDLFVDRFSRGLAGGLLLLFLFLVDNPINLITYVLLATLLLWIITAYAARKEYVNTFRNSLQRMLVDTDSIELNLNEPEILQLIRESLSSKNENQVLHTLMLLENSNPNQVAGELKNLLKHDNPEIRLRALKLLQQAEGNLAADYTESLLHDDDPDIRVEMIYYLCMHSEKSPSAVINSYLKVNDSQLQSSALGCSCRHTSDNSDLPDPGLFSQILNNLPENEKDRIVVKIQLAEALGYIDDRSLATEHLSKLVTDPHPSVIKKALQSIARQKTDRLIPILLEKLQKREFTIEIREALASFGSNYLTLYKNRFYDSDLDINIRKQIPGIFYYQPNQISVSHLEDMIEVDEPDLRYHVVKALNKIHRRYPELETDAGRIRSCLRFESKHYFNLLAVKAIQPANRPNSILLKALSEKMNQTLERMFRLLGLIYNQKDLYSAYLALQSSSAEKRSAAVEFVDNILESEDHTYIFPIIDDINEERKMKTGTELFNIVVQPYDKAIETLLDGNDRWLQACAIYSVSPVCPASLQERVDDFTRSDSELLRETALMVRERNLNR